MCHSCLWLRQRWERTTGAQTRCRCDFPSPLFSHCLVWVGSDPVSISTSPQFCVPQNGKYSYEQVNWVACVCLQQGLFISTQTLSTPGLDKVLEEILLSVREERWNPDASWARPSSGLWQKPWACPRCCVTSLVTWPPHYVHLQLAIQVLSTSFLCFLPEHRASHMLSECLTRVTSSPLSLL